MSDVRRRGLVRRILLGCKPWHHVWRRLYGDERMHRGAKFACECCGRRTDGPVDVHIDPAQDRVDDFKVRFGVEPGPPLEGRLPPGWRSDV